MVMDDFNCKKVQWKKMEYRRGGLMRFKATGHSKRKCYVTGIKENTRFTSGEATGISLVLLKTMILFKSVEGSKSLRDNGDTLLVVDDGYFVDNRRNT